mmetsp:Transcript_37838/g.96082  ORF Transcript_37838/g.96082 Transcript_37838/m.96082 type:complete len:1041 (+) Transcript_37838:56-3178(+)
MAGVSFDLLIGMMIFLIAVWGSGRTFRMFSLPAILGEFFAGVLLGPNMLDIVPFSSNGRCDTIIFPNDEAGSSSSSSSEGRMLAGSVSGPPCKSNLVWTPRWTISDTTRVGDEMHTPDIWSFMGTVGVTLLIMESGMHINFGKVKQIGAQALVVAIVGTTAPLVMGMLLVGGLFGQDTLYPDGFAAGCALAPTSVGISIKLLSDAKMLNSMAGQTTLTAAFIDDVFSLVLLVLLSSLAADADDAALVITLRTIAAFAFLGAGVYGGAHLLPMLDKPLARIPFVRGASIQPRDEVHLFFMLIWLGLCAYLGSLIGSHLLGAFVAGMCFVNVPRSHQVWVTQLKRIIRWLIRIFFAATVGFAVPIKMMLTLDAFWKGLVLGAVPGIFCKVVSGIAARNRWRSHAEKVKTSQASIMTRFGLVQPIQYLVGMAMVARGEFAFLVAYSASKMSLSDGKPMLSPPIYAAVTWALVWALIFAPFLFKWALSVYMRATPIKRGQSIGGGLHCNRNFVIQVIGAHHTGVLHEILNAIHGEGMDVLECRVETDGEVDTNYFVVQSRGQQKDFDDEKLQEVRHHIQEILGDVNAVVMFEAVDDDDFTFSAIELQVVTNSQPDAGAEGAHIVSIVTKRLQELGLDVEEIDEQHKLQAKGDGVATEMERDLFYAVPSANSEEGPITHRRVHQVKKALQSTLRDEDIQAEVLIKPVADRTKGFSELQTFNPQQAIARAKGSVWELLCFGPHDVELLSTAVRRLEPLGLRLLHAAHSHAEKSERSVHGGDAPPPAVLQQQCSRFFVERHGEDPEASRNRTPEETAAFSDRVLKVLMTTYKSDDKTEFTVRRIDPQVLDDISCTTSEMNTNLVPGLQDVLGLVPPSPDFNEFRRGLPMGLKRIPSEAAIAARPPAIKEEGGQGGGIFGNLIDSSLAADILARGPKPSARVQELEARMADLLALDSRVNRLEELELRHARAEARGGAKSPEPNSAKSPLQLSAPGSPKLDVAPMMAPMPFLSSPKTSFLTSPKTEPTPGPSLSSLGLPVALNAGSAG